MFGEPHPAYRYPAAWFIDRPCLAGIYLCHCGKRDHCRCHLSHTSGDHRHTHLALGQPLLPHDGEMAFGTAAERYGFSVSGALFSSYIFILLLRANPIAQRMATAAAHRVGTGHVAIALSVDRFTPTAHRTAVFGVVGDRKSTRLNSSH